MWFLQYPELWDDHTTTIQFLGNPKEFWLNASHGTQIKLLPLSENVCHYIEL
jgi:hypothetical protein